MANTYIKRTQVAGSRNKFTFSAWIKRGAIGTNQQILSCYHGNSDNGYIEFRFQGSGDSLHCSGYSTNWFRTNRAFRDTNAWYHVVYAVDTTLATSGNRMKLYVNGVEETSFATQSQPSQNFNLPFGESGSDIRIGVDVGANAQFFDGSMSHVHFCDGYTYQPSDFGSTDSTTGEWKINTSPSVSYGNNGFFILKDGNSVTDQSGQSHDCTVAGGTLTKTEDCPSNVFATLDFLNYKTSACTYTNGNTTVSFPGAWVLALGNMGVSSGKWYWEAKCNSGNNSNSYYGICSDLVQLNQGFYNNSQNGAIMIGVGSNGDTYIDGSYTSGGTSPINNNTDILGLALDLDSGTKTLKIYKNGTQLTTGGTINLSSYYDDTFVYPCFSGNTSSASASFNVNFGNGYFGTTAVSSAGTNASGLGIFEYNVPAGYTAICTKGLNE